MNTILGYLPFMLNGAKLTLGLFALTIVFSLPLGLPITFGIRSRIKPLSFICKVYVWLFRGTPLMLQLFFFYFFFPLALGIKMSVFPTAVLTFVLNYAAYFAEIYRGGIQSIDHGQYEAAYALGLSKRQTTFGIILPQMVKTVMPSIANEAITLVKDTALASAIGMVELMKATNATVNRLTDMTPFAVAAAIYLLITFILTVIAKQVEGYFGRYDAKGV